MKTLRISSDFGLPIDAVTQTFAVLAKRSSRDTYLQRLASRKLVKTVGRGEVVASENLFG